MRYWLVKTEPETYSFEDLSRDGRGYWDGVRNYQARNNLKNMKKGDCVIIYHSNANPSGVVGVARVVVEATIDPTQFEEGNKYQDVSSKPESPKWWGVDIEPLQKLRMISLKELQNMEELRNSALCKKGNRLSVIELSEVEYIAILNRGSAGSV